MRHGYAIDTTFRAVDRMSGPLARMEASVGRLGRKVDLSFSSIQQASMGMARRAAWAGAAMTAWPIATALATGEMTDSLNSLRQVGVRDVGAMRQAAIDFSNQWSGVTAPEFVAAAYDIRSAINLTDKTLVHFTRVNALTAKATKASTEEMKGAFTVGWGALRATMPKATDIAFLDRYAAAMVKTTGIFRATGGSMASAISNLGAEATNLGFSLETQLAILGRLQTTMSGEEAGTMFKSFLTQAQRNLGKLGPVFYKAFQQKDLVGMLDALNKRFGDMSDPRNSARLSKALGEIRAKQFVGLLQDTRAIRGEIQGIGLDARRGLPYVGKMASLVNEGVGAGAARARQQVQNLGLLIGDVTAPAVERLAARASKWILTAQKWVKENRPLVRQLSDMSLKWGPWIVGIAGATAGLTIMSGWVVRTVEVFGKLRMMLGGVTAATKAAAVAQEALNIAQGAPAGGGMTGMGPGRWRYRQRIRGVYDVKGRRGVEGVGSLEWTRGRAVKDQAAKLAPAIGLGAAAQAVIITAILPAAAAGLGAAIAVGMQQKQQQAEAARELERKRITYGYQQRRFIQRGKLPGPAINAEIPLPAGPVEMTRPEFEEMRRLTASLDRFIESQKNVEVVVRAEAGTSATVVKPGAGRKPAQSGAYK